ncbi:MAG: DUF4363 family protein [Clostridia bacterium]|nr:DUF4363 family protein [Clostridia bacterium]
MKAFIASICALTALLLLIVLNAAFIHRTANALEDRVTALNVKDENTLLELERYWQQKKTLIGLSVDTDKICAIDERIAEIHTAIAQGDQAELEAAARLALVAIECVRYSERCSIDNLL